ncbi:MAG TPA: histone deacetylase family protein [Spirochaetota bacterium]|nr:histone deacetylase family protein [Spirochaetota bacterium]HPC41316.1 histone deacetylase family protein [Spirochaetota bacterium]HPL19153.1 histone deacetylase family protein [Spirochaetota bacterium]HQF09753.1 histone deacetylase family protein [Spirochaetota bacterium]HQH98902.1 histone deacetylase family protein [Spirochaetota bacterium]
MKIVFHEKYYNSEYAGDPAAAPGRLDGIMEIISGNRERYEVIRPEPALEEDILRAHTGSHVQRIQGNRLLYEMSLLAAGGAILAAERAYGGNPSFAVIRPPGHHASADSCWGFCFFNNISVSLLRLWAEGKIKSAFVLDFDLHTGDGNINILLNRRDGFKVSILNPMSHDRGDYLREVREYMDDLKNIDIFVASAGFDQGIDDWGNLLYPEDYTELGRLMGEYSEKLCGGRRYALLEGGYNHDILGINVDAFCKGFA